MLEELPVGYRHFTITQSDRDAHTLWNIFVEVEFFGFFSLRQNTVFICVNSRFLNETLLLGLSER
jgi:hypothetical protein